MTNVNAVELHHSDIFPGLSFYFVYNTTSGVLPRPSTFAPFSGEGTWTVITKKHVEKLSGGYWKFLLLGPGPKLTWYDGQLGWICIVENPVPNLV